MENGTFRIYQSPNVVNLCIDTYDGERQGGRLWNQYMTEPFCFSTLIEALESMEALYDRLCYPYASTETRSFLEEGCREVGEEGILDTRGREHRVVEPFHRLISHRGQDATFIIRVQYRQHSSWQGEIVWVDGGRRRYFRSVLELLKLIDSAMEKDTVHDGK